LGIVEKGMAKIDLTIKTTYLPNWGAAEGIRELVQNGRDAEVEHNAPLTVDWYNDTLRIENEGTTMPLKALLLGHTTKHGNSEMIGKFGEGLKLGVLALVRAGHPVKIRNGAEVWLPKITRSDTFDENILSFYVTGGREGKNRVRVEVGGITKEAWEKMREGFLFLAKPKKNEMISTYSGTLLLGEQHKGRIYVKGIFVQTDSEASFGYDLRDAELDRDRKMVEAYNLRYHTRNIFLDAMNKQPSLHTQFDEMLQAPTLEVIGIEPFYTNGIPDAAVDYVTDAFLKRHGEDAVPVSSLAESKDIEHLGKKGVIVSKQLGTVLAKKLGDAMTVRERLSKEERMRYSWADVTPDERENLTEGIALVNAVEPLTLDQVEIVDFRSDTMWGQFKEGKVFLARKVLADRDETLRILVHEVAHRQGFDGDKGHVMRIEHIWKMIVRNLRTSEGR
jgi:hypothetical protein